MDIDFTAYIGIAAAALSVGGAAIAGLRYLRRQMATLATRIGNIEARLAVHPRAVVTRPWLGPYGWIETGTKVAVVTIGSDGFADVRVDPWRTEMRLPLDVLGKETPNE